MHTNLLFWLPLLFCLICAFFTFYFWRRARSTNRLLEICRENLNLAKIEIEEAIFELHAAQDAYEALHADIDMVFSNLPSHREERLPPRPPARILPFRSGSRIAVLTALAGHKSPDHGKRKVIPLFPKRRRHDDGPDIA